MPRTFSLTVITPVFNGGRHIEACLDNVRAQDCDAVEHLIVDGGSTDGTLDIIRRRMEMDASVRLIEGPDRGQSNAMNKGIVAASASILGVLNVDDHYLPGTLVLAISRLERAPEPSFLWGACKVHDHLNGNEYVQYPGNFVAWRMLLGWNVEPHPVNPVAYFYHRKLHFDAGLFDENEHYALDLEFLLRASLHVRSVIAVRDVLGVYEMAPGTKTYVDLQKGDSADRVRKVFKRFECRLSAADRSRLARWRMRALFSRANQHLSGYLRRR
ncbi:MAG: glycosyltransferase family 2 protein [Pseudomonadota bacterium]